MSTLSTGRKPLIASCLLLMTACLSGCFGCHSGAGGGLTPQQYLQVVSDFTIGTIAVQTADTSGHDETFLTKASQLAPDEPAIWANLGLMYLRPNRNHPDLASKYLNKAETLAPNNADIEKLLGLLGAQTGDTSAVQHYQKALQIDPNDLRTRYNLAQQLERQNDLAGAQQQIEAILQQQPYNLYGQTELIRLASKRGDTAALQQAISKIEERKSTFDSTALDQLKTLKAAANSKGNAAATQAMFLQNDLKQNSAYHQSYLVLVGETSAPGEPIEHFLKLPNPPATPAAPDTALTFAAQPLPGASGKARWAGAAWLNGDGKVTTLTSDGRSIRFADGTTLAFPSGPAGTPPGPYGVLGIDINYDMLIDFALAGRGGFKLYQQDKSGKFSDVTAQTKLPASILNAAYTGAWQADLDADGDIDIVLAPVSGPPVALRNNGNGSFKDIYPFAGVSSVRDFAWGDLEGGGNPDASFVDQQGNLHVFTNERGGLFRARPAPSGLGKIAAITVGDINNNGLIDLLALQSDGKILRIADKDHGSGWDVATIAQWANPPKDLAAGTARLFVADLDNNGGLDLIASTPTTGQVWLADAKWNYAPLPSPLPASVTSVVDLNGDGRLDLVGLNPQGQPVQMINSGAQKYGWQELRPQPAESEFKGSTGGGERRMNSFGIGGTMEARAGELYEKQVILSPVVHFGLGSYPNLDALRIIWPNGDVRSEFVDTLKPNQSIPQLHRVITSCPFLFAWNGKEMQFVTDCIWRSPLGLKINAQDTAGVDQTEDWVKIRGDQLVPRNGVYDLRMTAELWETHIFDHLSLLTVDHPVGTEIWVDERFSQKPPPLKLCVDPHSGAIRAQGIYVTTPLHPVTRAIDDNGTDVTAILSERDGHYLDTFGNCIYQGIVRDHWVEIDLGNEVPKTGPLWLVCQGWICPTNSSINVAISHSGIIPQGLSVETPDARGRWSVARSGLGFPEGKLKTILIDLNGLFRPGAARKLRLRTNLAIYWDAIRWASGLPQTEPQIRHLFAQTAELRYRGFSVLTSKDYSSPELPQSYDQLESTGEKWRDLIGYYTRYGDVRELLEKVDDRYVIMGAGDELRMTFAAQPAPPAGMARDYVLIGNGWVKDGNYNTTFSRTVLPLPTHARTDYNTPPGRLEDDPVYKLHRRDWQLYHTRYVTPDLFERGLRPGN